MKIIEEVVAEYLSTNNLGVYSSKTSKGNIYINNMPQTAPMANNFYISIIKTGGMKQVLQAAGGGYRPIITIYVKGLNFINTQNKINEITDFLKEKTWETDEYIIEQSYPVTDTLRLTQDENQAFLFDVNFLICINKK